MELELVTNQRSTDDQYDVGQVNTVSLELDEKNVDLEGSQTSIKLEYNCFFFKT